MSTKQPLPNPLNLTVKALKTWSGQEGGGFECKLCINDKPVLYVRDDATGGPLNVDALNDEGRATLERIKKEVLPSIPEQEYHGRKLSVSLDWYLGDIVSQYELQKKWNAALARARKNGQVPFRTEGDEPNSYRLLGSKARPCTDEQARAFLSKKYGDKFVIL